MQLERGDVLIQGNDKYSQGTHALMWIGGDKPVIHSSNEKFLGVLQQSMDYFGKYVPQAVDARRELDTGVYRYQGPPAGLAHKAARFAEGWAANSMQVEPGGYVSEGAQKVMRTPFSARRLGDATERRKAKGTGVSVETIFRVLKAIARTESSSLSPNHGVSCSQFVVYCYQAAALTMKIGDVLPPELLTAMKGERRAQRPEEEKLRRYVDHDMREPEADLKTYWRNKGWWAEQGMFRK